MREVSFIIVIILSISIAKAQDFKVLEKLKSDLKEQKDDSTRASILFLIGYNWAEYNIDSMHYYSRHLFKLVDKHPSNQYILLMAQRLKGLAYDYNYKTDSAIYHYQQYQNIALQLQDTMHIVLSYFNIGTVFLIEGQYIKVLPYYEEAMRLCELHGGLNTELSMIYNNLGIVYRRVRKYNEAAKVYRKALHHRKAHESVESLLNLYINIANNFVSLDIVDSAKYYYQKILEYPEFEQNHFRYAYNGLGVISYDQKENQLAEDFFLKSLALGKLNDLNLDLTAHGYLGAIYVKQQKLEKAGFHFNEALKIQNEETLGDQTKEFYLQLVDYYKALGNFDQALGFLEKYNQLSNRLLNEEIIDRTAEWEERYQSQQKEKEITELQLANQLTKIQSAKERNQRNIFMFSTLLFLLLGGFIFYQYRQNQKTNKLLSDKNFIIEKALEEKNLLMREIHHRVKNNLQVITSLLNMQTYFIEDVKATAAVQDSRNRVHAMSLIHQSLYSQEDVTEVNINDYLQQLCANLENGFNTEDKEIELHTDIDNVAVDVDTAIPLGLIVNELVTNAYKHAFEGRAEGEVKVVFKQNEQQYQLTIADNGKGTSGKPMERKGSLGMRLLRDLGKKLKAEMEVLSTNGTQIVLTFPIKTKLK